MLLEQEQWGAVEVHAQFQQMVERLETRAQAEQAGINGRAAEPATAAGDSSIHPPPPVAVGQANGGALEPVARKFTITPHDAQPASARTLVVAGTAYHVVDTELVLISMLGEYLAFRDAVPAFAAEVAQRVLELLKVFNSRTCQLVLGAGAMQVGVPWHALRAHSCVVERMGLRLPAAYAGVRAQEHHRQAPGCVVSVPGCTDGAAPRARRGVHAQRGAAAPGDARG